jgi:hypothetical protein
LQRSLVLLLIDILDVIVLGGEDLRDLVLLKLIPILLEKPID